MSAKTDPEVLNLRPDPKSKKLQQKRTGFYVAAKQEPLPKYSTLNDEALFHFWSNPGTQNHMLQQGFLAPDGTIIDIDK